jgi:hypothetical protein
MQRQPSEPTEQRDRPARSDQLEIGAIGLAFVKPSTAVCFKFFDLSLEYSIGVLSPKLLNTKIYKNRN